MTWWEWTIMILLGYGLLVAITEGEALHWTLFLLLLPLLAAWWLMDRLFPGSCRCGYKPPKAAVWCSRCGINVRDWRDKGVTCYRASRTDPAHRASSPAPPPKRSVDTTGPRPRTRTDVW